MPTPKVRGFLFHPNGTRTWFYQFRVDICKLNHNNRKILQYVQDLKKEKLAHICPPSLVPALK